MHEVESGVPSTPEGGETHRGARNRAHALKKESGDLFVAFESGLVERDGILFEECWCVVFDVAGRESVGVSSAIQVPEKVLSEMRNGKPHGAVLKEMRAAANIQNKETWGVYSKGLLMRSTGMFEACRNALVSYFVKHDI